ncbi:hypothetical protein B0H13DRAFT_1935297 [Mycena leptocephala]|nr:hypothetical protein B0H13DRAFT_1935297 [Mycena leptocephala]
MEVFLREVRNSLRKWREIYLTLPEYGLKLMQFNDGTMIMTQARHSQNSHEIQKTGFFTLSVTFSDASTTATIMQYFERNWFIPLWRDSWTDIGLPGGRNRDTISTFT